MAKHAKHSDEDFDALEEELLTEEPKAQNDKGVRSPSRNRRARSESVDADAPGDVEYDDGAGEQSKRGRHAKRQHAATVLSPTLAGMVTEGARGKVSITEAHVPADDKMQVEEELAVAALAPESEPELAEPEVFSWPPVEDGSAASVAETVEPEVFSWPPVDEPAAPDEPEVFSWPPADDAAAEQPAGDSAPRRAGQRTGKRNLIEDRMRAQAALDNPNIFAGLTPTGTGCPDPNDPDAVARARAKRQARNDHRGEVVPMSAKEVFQQNWKNMLMVAALVVVFVVLLVVIRGAVSVYNSFTQTSSTQSAPTYVSPYSWQNLDRTNGRYRYIVDGKQLSRLGVDVSENQFDIDWNAVKNDGIDFAFIRLGYRGSTEGGLYTDSYYQANIDGASNAGLDVGVYFFSQATTTDEAVEEARYVINNLGGRALQYPIAFDSEVVNNGRTVNLSSDEMDAICSAFCQTVEEAGYRSIVYGNSNDLSRYDVDNITSRGIWWAEYNMPSPTAIVDIIMWQYSNGGQVAGISTAVDMTIDMTQAYEEAKANS